jgi:hypothetical protein
VKSAFTIVASSWLMINALFSISVRNLGKRLESATWVRVAIEKCPIDPQVSDWSIFQSRMGSTSSNAQTRERRVASAKLWGRARSAE